MTLTNAKQAFMEHMTELRKALTYSVVTLVICFVLVFVLLCEPLMDFVLQPIHSLGIELVYTTLAEVWVTKMKVSFIAAFVVSFPLITFFIWRFLRPALYPNERKMIGGVFFASLILFLIGITFAFIAVLALTINFFVTSGTGTALPMLTISKYVSFLTSFLIPFGLVFLLPLAVYVLTKLGVLSPETLVKSRKYVIVILAVLAAIITPPDIISQLLILIPMLILWEASILLAKRVKVSQERQILKNSDQTPV